MPAISVKHLLGGDPGAVSEDAVLLAEPLALFSLEEDGVLGFDGPLEAIAHILRVEGGFQVELHDLRVQVQLECHTCLRPYIHALTVPKTASVLFGLPNAEDTPDFDVDVTKARLPLDMFIRQEVLLALPIMQKCDRPDCIIPGIREDDGTIQPFAGLKDLL